MERRDRKGNLFDVFLVLLLILGIVGLILRGYRSNRSVPNEELEIYTVIMQMTCVPYPVTDSLSDGALIYTAEGEVFGILESHSVTPAKIEILQNGEVYRGIWEGESMCDVRLEIEIEGTRGERGLLRRGRYAVLCGQELILYSDTVRIQATVFDFHSETATFLGF